MEYKWKLVPGYVDEDKTSVHQTITESTTGIVACGFSWCQGECGLPALVLQVGEKEYKAYGAMVACGPVFQDWRVPWTGKKIPVSLDMPVEDAIKLFWN